MFAKQKKAAHVVENLHPEALLEGVTSLFLDTERCLNLGQLSLELSHTIFDPNIIHQDLKTHISKLLNHDS